ncbi:rhodanese-like domain-containing protein [Isoptericola sp. b441]|uniref:Rhodanese-like domain-containing protein n=1 Tax=Actinotalea lenta TaxID=3064654 RepID=A0ABT9DAX2_9CELL|nr:MULTISPECIES: rhodanese-like domain-containing protein [unclassified Isoptericola]MDO8108050.1 rhodanese-like domain-containing protein [Isoptericola sp. b441]MDO8120281.1 rhodanese-like domain-containing protein [Isoptericola sp. b490]
MASTKRMTRAEQREAWHAERAAAKARAERQRRLRIGAVSAIGVAILGVVAALALGAGGSAPTADANGTQYSAARDDFRLPGLLDDSTVSLADFAGTPVVVNFFASWCVYCNEELPGFVQVAKATDGKVAFVGVNTSDPGDGAAMARRFDLAGAGFALAADIGGNPPSQLWSSFGSQGLPVTAFYDATGTLVDFSGGMLTQAELEKRLQADFGVSVSAPDAEKLGSPVIPLIPQGAYELLRTHANDPSFVPLDLRPAADFAQGHVPGAVNVEATAADAASAVASLDPSASYFVYDASGSGSPGVADAMHAAGFTHVYEIQGGYAAWVQQGLPTTP